MDFQEALLFLYNNLPMYQRVGPSAFKKDLTNTIKLCDSLGNPQEQFRSIHIAGTNGKGSVAHSIAAVLQTSDYKVGLYTSPHLKSFTERIRVNGQSIPEMQVAGFVSQNLSTLLKIQPSFFEMSVAMAFDHFAREKVDVAVIEVGLGGRLDSTNIVKPILSVITNIGYDHQEMLGNTLVEIAAEKAGIIKTEVPVVVSEYQKEVASVFHAKAKECSAPLYFASQNFRLTEIHRSDNQRTFRVNENRTIWPASLTIDLLGGYQSRNLPGVLQVLKILPEIGLPISGEAAFKGLSRIALLTGIKGSRRNRSRY